MYQRANFFRCFVSIILQWKWIYSPLNISLFCSHIVEGFSPLPFRNGGLSTTASGCGGDVYFKGGQPHLPHHTRISEESFWQIRGHRRHLHSKGLSHQRESGFRFRQVRYLNVGIKFSWELVSYEVVRRMLGNMFLNQHNVINVVRILQWQ